jgi:hypothetical protein
LHPNHKILRNLDDSGLPRMTYPLACALVVIGARCWMIGHYGSPTPFWDQWDAEGAILFPKYFNGTLQFSDLISAHNEHRILVTRLWSLLLLELAGYWDVILQMVANTLIVGAVVALVITAFQPILDRALWMAFALFAMVAFSSPLAWENTLEGFNSGWYFMLLFSIGGLVAISDAFAFTTRWWAGLAMLILSYFCLASGALTVASAFSICVVQFSIRRRSGLRELLALAILAMATAATLRYIPLSRETALKAHSIGEFFRALLGIMSWPATPGPVPAIVKLLGATLINTPVLLASVWIIRLRPPFPDRRWFLISLAGWSALQVAAIAYGRAAYPVSSRYLDLLTVTLLLNVACLLYLLSALSESWLSRRVAFGVGTLWLLVILPGAFAYLQVRSIPDVVNKGALGRIETENLRAYLNTGDIRVLENKPRFDIPYPLAPRLAQIVSSPITRALLSPELVGDASAKHAQQRGLARFSSSLIESFKNYMLRWGVLLIPAGLTFFVLAFATQYWGRESEPSWSQD